MPQVISFDDKCKEKDTLRYVEIVRRRACARMAVAEANHQQEIQSIYEKSDAFKKKMDKAWVVLIVASIAVLIWIVFR